MPVPGEIPPPMPAPASAPTPGLTEFPTFTFPPPPAKPGHVVLNRFVLYETKTRFFVIGTNAPAGTRFRVLKIDRTTAPDELSITEDEAVYTKSEVDDLLDMIAHGNKSTGGMREICKFYGIVGFVRFTEGYYITLITKRSPVALIGGHYIFHIDATSTISIHSSTTPTSKLDKNSDEARYLQMFQMVDLTKNFYFSYSYDITRTLQWNMTRDHQVEGRNRMFVWNQYLLENAFGELTGIENQWALPIMYGFVDQSKLSVLGRNVYVTLIARRSRFFAGARFLKRGVNDSGYVANDVETEQIVSEMSITSFYGAGSLGANPNHTSFVQHRGSIPLYWTQDGTNMSPKPAIELNVIDPYFSAAALHFDDMFKRYGAPCIVLNLIKAKEKTPRESLLLKEFSECIEYLNQFLPEDKKIWHIKWDMSRASKSRNENVISVLEIIAEKTFAQTGFFHSGFNQDPAARQYNKNVIYGSGLQNGVVRTNCIDCLDRTNAAQFIIAKCALGHQLYSLGLIAEPVVPFDCDVVNMLTEMYHDHGDTIALQYGGSHLVNTMETYRKINQWTSHSRDMIESIRRFYSNSFVDAEKQDAMNLFLGNYRVRKGSGPALWELPGDYHLHNITDPELRKIRKSYIRWWTPEALLPQDVLARKSFLEAQQQEMNRFRLHDAGYDEYDGENSSEKPFGGEFDGEYFNMAPENDQQEEKGDEGEEKEEQHDSAYRLNHHHIEHLLSEDENEFAGGGANQILKFGAAGRVNSMDSGISDHSSQSSMNGPGAASADVETRRSSLALSKISSTHSVSSTQIEAQGQGSPPQTRQQQDSSKEGIRTSRSNPMISALSQPDGGGLGDAGESKSGRESSLDGSMLDFKERIVAPLSMHKNISRPGTAAPMSSSSSASSMRQYQHHQLRTSGSKSSLAMSSIGGRPWSLSQFSRGEQYVYDGFDACDDGGGAGGGGGGMVSAAWEEYWDEYYRPKVQTSFQRLFAYNMNSTSRYIPPNVKSSSEQSPFEVRQNHNLSSQAEMSAKAAAKSEKPSMLSWLSLTGGTNKNNSNSNNQNNKKSNNSKSGSNYANGSKTLPLSTGRKKGFLSSLDEDPAIQEKNSVYGRKDGTAHHARSSRLSIATFPSSEGSEFDEKASIRAQQQQGQDGKVHLPAHVPRSKEEEWELTKNVSTNLPQFAIHDSSFIPGSEKKGEDPSDEKPKAAKDGPAAVSTEAGGKGRSHLEESVRRSLHPEVTLHESKEYKRYTQQFKTIRFDSVPTKGASLLGVNALASQKNVMSAETTPNTVNADIVHQQRQYKDSKDQPDILMGMNVSSSSSTVRPSLTEAQKMQDGGSSTSTMTIATTELNEEEEFYYAVSRAESKPNMRVQVATTTANGTTNGVHSPISPLTISPFSSGSGLPTAAAGQLQLPHQQQQLRQDQDAAKAVEGDHHISHYLPEPPILLAPVQTTIKPPSESEMVLYNAHVELPKLTLYTVGQTSLNPYWGASSGTRARYDAYMMWILKGRYGNMTMPTASAAAAATSAATALGGNGGGFRTGSGANGVSAGNSGVFMEVSSGAGGTRPSMRRESSSIYPTIGEHNSKADGEEGLSGPTGHAGGNKEQQPHI